MSKGKETYGDDSEVSGLERESEARDGFSLRRSALPKPPHEELPNSIPELRLTNKQLDQAAVDRLLEEAGFTTVDELDAEDYRLIRETKVLAIKKLRHRLKKEGQSVPILASVVQKLGQGEKDKLGAIHLKIGRPSDRPKSGVTFRAKIGVAKAPQSGTQFVFEVESSDYKTALPENA